MPGQPRPDVDNLLNTGNWSEIDDFQNLAADQLEKDKARFLEHCSQYRALFASDAGRYVLHDLVQNFLVQRVVVPGDSPADSGIRGGQADVVMRILGYIQFANDPENPGNL